MTLQTNGITRAHAHSWSFIHGGGNQVRCALGRGSHLSAVNSQEVIDLIQEAHERANYSFRDLIVANALDPETSEATRWAAMACSIEPSSPATNTTSFVEKRNAFTNELCEYLDLQRR